ncbi:hypothetical protein PUN28_007529 [Cardiocondyla obscurior]|uniref:Uncharacterized protein n=1 Tax=Cardiocondyla obscurior TaxID=286306 RepID=A0AAW2G8V1_9HYME
MFVYTTAWYLDLSYESSIYSTYLSSNIIRNFIYFLFEFQINRLLNSVCGNMMLTLNLVKIYLCFTTNDAFELERCQNPSKILREDEKVSPSILVLAQDKSANTPVYFFFSCCPHERLRNYYKMQKLNKRNIVHFKQLLFFKH